MQYFLGPVDPLQLLPGQMGPVFKAGCQTRIGRLVKGRNVQFLRIRSDLVLCHFDIRQRRKDTKFPARFRSRTVFGQVVHILSVQHIRDPVLKGHPFDFRHDRLLAPVAPFLVVVFKLGDRKNIHIDHDVIKTFQIAEGFVQILLRDHGTTYKDREHIVLSEHVQADVQKKIGIATAAVGDRDFRVFCDLRAKLFVFRHSRSLFLKEWNSFFKPFSFVL